MDNDIVARLRESDGGYFMRKMFTEAADEIERLRRRLLAEENAYDIERRQNEHLQTDRNNLELEVERLRKERDEARLQTRRILNEIDCRIEHGAESNGHLEAIYNLFKEATDDR